VKERGGRKETSEGGAHLEHSASKAHEGVIGNERFFQRMRKRDFQSERQGPMWRKGRGGQNAMEKRGREKKRGHRTERSCKHLGKKKARTCLPPSAKVPTSIKSPGKKKN